LIFRPFLFLQLTESFIRLKILVSAAVS